MIGLQERRRLIQPSTISKLFITIDSYDGCNAQGKVCSAFDNRTVRFLNLWELARWTDKLFNEYDFPQASHEYRSFFDEKQAQAIKDKEFSCEIGTEMQSGKLATFIVHVQFRQNTTWQGAVQWIEQKSTQRFRSAFELLRMVDEALKSDVVRSD